MARLLFGPVCIVVIQTDLYCEKCARSFRFADRDWDICAYRITGYFEHCCRDGTSSDNGYYVAFLSVTAELQSYFLMAEMGIALGISRKIRLE